MERRKEGMNEERKDGREEGRKRGRKGRNNMEGRTGGGMWREGRKGGGKEGTREGRRKRTPLVSHTTDARPVSSACGKT
jgi:hypothetical protein